MEQIQQRYREVTNQYAKALHTEREARKEIDRLTAILSELERQMNQPPTPPPDDSATT